MPCQDVNSLFLFSREGNPVACPPASAQEGDFEEFMTTSLNGFYGYRFC